MKRRFLASLFILCSACFTALAQDYNLTNHNLVPFSLNPALVGNANADRASLDFRQQWPTLDNDYTTLRASYDRNFYKRMCSLGASYTMDNLSSVYTTNEIALAYSHTLQLRELMYLRLGLQGSCFINKFGSDKLVYGDQYDYATGKADPNTIEDITTDTRTVFDFSVGASFNIENKFSIGASVYHIGEPDNGFVEKSANSLSRKFVVHANYMLDLQYSNGNYGRRDLSNTYLFFNAAYQQQADFQMGYLGVGLFISPIILGVAEKTDLDDEYITAFMAGVTFKGFQIYYVYDLFTGSRDNNGSWSHEIALVYIHQNKEKYPCPVTYW